MSEDSPVYAPREDEQLSWHALNRIKRLERENAELRELNEALALSNTMWKVTMTNQLKRERKDV